ncbi:MAG: hypothetical protein IK064_00375, partial [Clostridia bacterium]|nr:hypothetical protein [Clostridia bacterium]
MAKKLLSIFVAIFMVMAIMPTAVFARTSAVNGETFTVGDTVAADEAVSGLAGEEKAGPEAEKGLTAFQTFDFEYTAESQFAQEWQLIDSDGDGH